MLNLLFALSNPNTFITMIAIVWLITLLIGIIAAITIIAFKVTVWLFRNLRWLLRACWAMLRNDKESKYYKEYLELERYYRVYNTLGRRPFPKRSL